MSSICVYLNVGLGRASCQSNSKQIGGLYLTSQVRLAPQLMVRNSTDAASVFSPAQHLEKRGRNTKSSGSGTRAAKSNLKGLALPETAPVVL